MLSNNFGLEIGLDFIALSKISKYNNDMYLTNIGYVNFAKNITKYNERLSSKDVSQSLEKLIEDTKLKTRNCFLTVPSRLTTIGFCQIKSDPLVNIPLTISKYFKDNLSPDKARYKLDWQQLPIIYPNQDKSIKNYIVIGIKKSLLNLIDNFCKRSNLELVGVEPDIISVSRAIIGDNKLTALIINFGKISLELIMFVDGQPIYFKQLDIGIDNWIKLITKELKITNKQAIELLRELDGQKIKELLKEDFILIRKNIKNLLELALKYTTINSLNIVFAGEILNYQQLLLKIVNNIDIVISKPAIPNFIVINKGWENAIKDNYNKYIGSLGVSLNEY